MKELKEGICSLDGIEANGIRGEDYGLALISSSGKTVGVFTKNKVQAAPVKFTSGLIEENKKIDNVLVNSGCANAFTGKKGYEDAVWMSSLIDGKTGVCSTGIIGKRIDKAWIKKNAKYLKDNLLSNKEGSRNAADAIRTTDSFIKEIGVQIGDVKVAGIAKGSGMIEPNMGTMLCFLYTNADFSQKFLKRVLKKAVDKSFNMIVVDGDTSTNDSVLLTSTESLDECEKENFEKALKMVSEKLAKMIAKDGEGSTKLIQVTTKEARNNREAKSASKEVLRSPLVKTMFYGESSNLGRIVSALGNSEAFIEEENLEVTIQNEKVIDGGRIVAEDSKIQKLVSNDEIHVEINLKLGLSKANAWGCDLSPDYVKINAGYA